jgi:hypothetical protein
MKGASRLRVILPTNNTDPTTRLALWWRTKGKYKGKGKGERKSKETLQQRFKKAEKELARYTAISGDFGD